MRTVFVPVSLEEAEYAISTSGLAKLGVELIPIPATGGCVIAVREVARPEKTRGARLHVRWLDQVTHLRVELQVNSFLRTLAVPGASADAQPVEVRLPH